MRISNFVCWVGRIETSTTSARWSLARNTKAVLLPAASLNEPFFALLQVMQREEVTALQRIDVDELLVLTQRG